ncbi:unnamed protein product, partial [Ectocarpus fasciculatus]
AAPFRSAWERATTRRQAKPTTQRCMGVSSGAGQVAAAGLHNEDAWFSAGSGESHVRGRHKNGGRRAGSGLALAMSAVGRPPQLARPFPATSSLSSYTRPDAHMEARSSGDVPERDLASKQGVSIPGGGVSATGGGGIESSAAPGAGSRRQVAGREARTGMEDAAASATVAADAAGAAGAAGAGADAAGAVGGGNGDRFGVANEEEKDGDDEWCPRAARASACEEVPQLTEAFREFDEKHPGATIIYLAHSGSRLYGTNTAKSDVDLRGVFIPDVQKEEEARRAAAQVKAVGEAQQDMGGDTAVPGDAKEARVPNSSSPAVSRKGRGKGKGKEMTFWFSTSDCDSRNTMDDVDVEIISLDRFFGQLIRAEIAGVETLHSMLVRDVELISDPEIVPIVVRERRWMVSRQLSSWMGFILSHIGKYRRVTQQSTAARYKHKAAAAAAAAAAAGAAAGAAPTSTSRGPGVRAPTTAVSTSESSKTSTRATTVSAGPPQATAGDARVGNRVQAGRPEETAATGSDTGDDNTSLNLVSASLEASTTPTETQNMGVSPEGPAREDGDPSRLSSTGGGGEGEDVGEKKTAVDTAPAGVAGDVKPPVRKLGVNGREQAPARVVKEAAPEEAPRLGVISRRETGAVESSGAASSQGGRRLGVLSRGGVQMGGERVAEQEVEEEEDWEEKEAARTLRRGKLLLHARRGVMEAEELLTTGKLTFPLKRRYVRELRRLK